MLALTPLSTTHEGTKLLTSGLGSVPKLFDAKAGIAIQLKEFSIPPNYKKSFFAKW